MIELAGVTRKQLDNYSENQVIKPLYGSSPTSKLWTCEQASFVKQMPTLQHAGLSIKDIADLANQGMNTVRQALINEHIRELRKHHRKLKNLLYCAWEESEIENLGNVSGTYLRYIPERWMALIPLKKDEEAQSFPRFASSYMGLHCVAETLGWCLTDLSGILCSLNAGAQEGSTYLYTALAAAPMPSFVDSTAADCGCYHVIDPSLDRGSCDNKDCNLCSLFGRNPSDSEVFRWNSAERIAPDQWKKTVMVQNLSEPYPSGMWADCTRYWFTQEADRPSNKAKKDTWKSTPWEQDPTVKPRLMPHGIRLPLGVTACVLPAGVYLCQQCEEGKQEPTILRMIGLTTALKCQDLTLEDELELCAKYQARFEQKTSRQPHSPSKTDAKDFIQTHMPCDPTMLGWHHKATSDDLQKLLVQTNTALAPEDGFCITCAALPAIDRNTSTRYEVQIMVNADKIIPLDTTSSRT